MLHNLMKSKKLSRTVQYSANDMYALVSDIESYPYFVPACKSLEVIKKRKDGDIIYIDAIMEDVDEDKDGQINAREFARWYSKSLDIIMKRVRKLRSSGRLYGCTG